MSAFPYASVPVWISNMIGGHLAAVGLANELMEGAVEVAATVKTRRFVLRNEQARHLADILNVMRAGATPAMRQALGGLAKRLAEALEDAAIRGRLRSSAAPIKIAGGEEWGRWLVTATELEAAGFTFLDSRRPGDAGPWRSQRVHHPKAAGEKVWMYDAVWPELATIQLWREKRLLLEPPAERKQSRVIALGGNVYSLAHWLRAGASAETAGGIAS